MKTIGLDGSDLLCRDPIYGRKRRRFLSEHLEKLLELAGVSLCFDKHTFGIVSDKA